MIIFNLSAKLDLFIFRVLLNPPKNFSGQQRSQRKGTNVKNETRMKPMTRIWTLKRRRKKRRKCSQ